MIRSHHGEALRKKRKIMETPNNLWTPLATGRGKRREWSEIF